MWSAVGLGVYIFTRPTSAAQQEEAIRRKEDPLPHEVTDRQLADIQVFSPTSAPGGAGPGRRPVLHHQPQVSRGATELETHQDL